MVKVCAGVFVGAVKGIHDLAYATAKSLSVLGVFTCLKGRCEKNLVSWRNVAVVNGGFWRRGLEDEVPVEAGGVFVRVDCGLDDLESVFLFGEKREFRFDPFHGDVYIEWIVHFCFAGFCFCF